MGKSKAPDMSGVNAAAVQNAEIGREQLKLAREQMVKDEARQAEYDPVFKQLLESSVEQSDLAAKQSAQQWQSYKDTWMPMEQKLADTAANYDTPERRESEAATARADVGVQAGQARQALQRDMGRQNLTLGGGRGLALASGSRMAEAKMAAGADSQARRSVEQVGISLVDNAAKFGRNMTSTGIESARLSLAANSNAGGTMGQHQSVVNAGLAGGQGFYGGAVGATSSAGNLLLGGAQLKQQNNQFNAAFQQELLGAAVGAGSSAMLMSSEETKNVEGDVDADAALESVKATPVKAWRYKHGDGRLRLGPMAEDVAASTGVGDGKTLDIATELGTLRAAMQGLNKKVDKIASAKPAPKRLTLAEGVV